MSFWAQLLYVLPMLTCGCVAGANEDTLVDELRVVAIAVDPPEVSPGETFTATMHIASPSDSDVEVGAWTCAGFGGECLEQLTTRASLAEGAPPLFELELEAPYETSALLYKSEEFPISVWSMACEAGGCPLLADIEAGEADADVLADPTLALEDLPLLGVSVARKSIWISNRDAESRRQSPEILPQFEGPLVGTSEEPVSLVFDISGDATDGYGYATGGGFDMTEYTVVDGVLTMDWYAPEVAGEYTLWVVAQSDDGGSAVWSSTATAE